MTDGWGRLVEDDLRRYLREIAESLGGAGQSEETELQVKNALEELEGKELKVATDVECSHYFETLLQFASPGDILAVLGRVGQRDTLFTVASKYALAWCS
jgi:hypothetical protein